MLRTLASEASKENTFPIVIKVATCGEFLSSVSLRPPVPRVVSKEFLQWFDSVCTSKLKTHRGTSDRHDRHINRKFFRETIGGRAQERAMTIEVWNDTKKFRKNVRCVVHDRST